MRQLIREIWNHLRGDQPSQRRNHSSPGRVRLHLESLEDRVTPAASVLANGVLSGLVHVGTATNPFAGVTVTLTGSTTTGRTVNTSTASDGNGAFSFSQLLPGTYNLSSQTPGGFVSGNSVSGIKLAQGQTVSGFNLNLPGLDPANISLADFLAIPRGIPVPSAGAGATTGFSLNGPITLANKSLAAGATTYVDLSGSFVDPDTTNTNVTFNTSKGAINVTLFGKDNPITVTNFLNYLQNNAFKDALFHRMANTATEATGTPQILQGGQYTVVEDASNKVTGITALPLYQPIQNESNDAIHPNAIGTIAMARAGVNTATSQFYFNLTDNTHNLGGTRGNGYAVFGQVSDATSLANLQSFATAYTARPATVAGSSLASLPVLKSVSSLPAGFPTGAPAADLARVLSTTVTTPTGNLTYTVSSDNSIVVATLGTLKSTFSPNQLKLEAKTLPSGTAFETAIITVTATDARGETVTSHFTVTVR